DDHGSFGLLVHEERAVALERTHGNRLDQRHCSSDRGLRTEDRGLQRLVSRSRLVEAAAGSVLSPKSSVLRHGLTATTLSTSCRSFEAGDAQTFTGEERFNWSAHSRLSGRLCSEAESLRRLFGVKISQRMYPKSAVSPSR